MRKYTKAEGGYIDILFDVPLIGDSTDHEGCFTVVVPEYNWIPGGEIINVNKTVVATFMRSSRDDILRAEEATYMTNIVGETTFSLAAKSSGGD